VQFLGSIADANKYYEKIGKESDLREPYRLPGQYLVGLGDPIPALPMAPTLVLINSRSGGHAGPQLTRALRRAIGHAQARAPPSHRL
jgi:hypothetical protein